MHVHTCVHVCGHMRLHAPHIISAPGLEGQSPQGLQACAWQVHMWPPKSEIWEVTCGLSMHMPPHAWGQISCWCPFCCAKWAPAGYLASCMCTWTNCFRNVLRVLTKRFTITSGLKLKLELKWYFCTYFRRLLEISTSEHLWWGFAHDLGLGSRPKS